MQAGLGRKKMQMDENATYDDVCAQLKDLFPKFQEVKGGWLVYKSSGGWGSRKLNLIPPDESGYSAKHLKAATQGFKGVLYIAPLQMELETTALPPESESFNDMPKEKCQKCGITYPLVILTAHIKSCVTTDEAEQTNQATCPICQNEMPLDVIEIHASFCTGDSTPPLEFNASMEEPSTSGFSVPVTHTGDHSNAAEATSMSYDWKTEPDKNKAASLYTKEIICQHEMRKPLLMTMDLRMDKEDQDKELVAFYKQNGIE
ncbi:uncharacterized protein [Sinocyclocheilus grahami]|uniref:uncharacterized protein isoform X2 n=1 Tax=Sinocyclocheilus grahami TaxID=75366 RepID=UPI0007AC8DB1|nr:PREDICTED: uncharacterized protein LOC107552434 isoform X2 [Sinocyclocheilus grahami]